jgi:Prolyl-tRNA synthetase
LKIVAGEELEKLTSCKAEFVGPLGADLPVIVDRELVGLKNLICGASKDHKYLANFNWDRDLRDYEVADLVKVLSGDLSPDGKGKLELARGIEVGQLFQLSTKYSQAMQATVLDEDGSSVELYMGCYGIGVSRSVAAIIEQNHDQRGIIWPEAVAPFQIALVPMNLYKSSRVRELAEKIYSELIAAGLEVFFDDRQERAGILFADMDLIGIPHRVVVGESNLDQGMVEYKHRSAAETKLIPFEKVTDFMLETIKVSNL